MTQVTNLDELKAWANTTGVPWYPLLNLESETDGPNEIPRRRRAAGDSASHSRT